MVELGISTFGETTPLEKTGEIYSHDERIRQLVKEIELADAVGLDVYGIGEHHREDFAVSAPEIVLAAGALQYQADQANISSFYPFLHGPCETIPAICHNRCFIKWQSRDYGWSWILYGVFSLVWL